MGAGIYFVLNASSVPTAFLRAGGEVAGRLIS
jgi:hypothetical protein